ncbi:unnamed protein product [Clonostachys solani]|uniref:Uncharacterized protein n=1 Tax=Clonostachys solani TaxID=160281 RepID=A0A9N9ZFZ3_9HYPO|nr:unnamed protein product [Clonostachys solani]
MMESPRTSTPSTLATSVDHPSSRYPGIPDHIEVVSKVNNCAQQLTTAINQLLETSKWDIERAKQEIRLIEERLQDLESEKAEVLQCLHETEVGYEVLEDAIMEKDEEIQQNLKALQSAAEENTKLEHGRALAISVMNETQHTAAISEALANEKAKKALQAEEAALQKLAVANQSEAASHHRAQQLQEERNSAVNARDNAECRAGEEEKARKEAEGRAEELERNLAYMISSITRAETRAEKAEADMAAAVEREKETRRKLEAANSIDQGEAAIRYFVVEARRHDERLTGLAQDINRVVKDWGTNKMLLRPLPTRLRSPGWRRGVAFLESSLRVRCFRHGGEVAITAFYVVSLTRWC